MGGDYWSLPFLRIRLIFRIRKFAVVDYSGLVGDYLKLSAEEWNKGNITNEKERKSLRKYLL